MAGITQINKAMKLEDLKEGQQVDLWTHQGGDPYESRTIVQVDLIRRLVWLKPDKWEENCSYFTECEFIESLKP